MNIMTEQTVFETITECNVCGCKELVAEFPFRYESNSVLEIIGVAAPTNVELLKCTVCNHRLPSIQLSPDSFEQYYSRNSVFYDQSRLLSGDYHRTRHLDIVRFVEKYASSGRVLDVGCGVGHLLSHFDRKKWTRYGVEPSPAASVSARSNSGGVIITDYLNRNSFQHRFDAITSVDVLEHLQDPYKFVSVIRDCLVQSGVVVFCTGNASSLAAQFAKQQWNYFGSWEHVSFFCPKSIAFVLEKCGFELLEIKQVRFSNEIGTNVRLLLKTLRGSFCNRDSEYYSFGKDHMLVAARAKY